MLVEDGHEEGFEQYIRDEGLLVCGWLNEESLGAVEQALVKASA